MKASIEIIIEMGIFLAYCLKLCCNRKDMSTIQMHNAIIIVGMATIIGINIYECQDVNYFLYFVCVCVFYFVYAINSLWSVYMCDF